MFILIYYSNYTIINMFTANAECPTTPANAGSTGNNY